MAVVAEEYFGQGQGRRTGVWLDVSGGAQPAGKAGAGSDVVYLRSPGQQSSSLWWSLCAAFLPEGYPSSVTPDYLPFQIWDTLQGLSTYVRSMLSTQVLLGALGVGQLSATALGATFQWFIRDFTGMLGGILFTLFRGSSLDSNAKQWRLAADLINDVGMLLDLLSPLYPRAFLAILCLGSISRAITGTASGATRAALTQHFALRQNAADLSAKEGSQETAATMAGMLLGMGVARATAGNVGALWACFLALTLFHMYANYRAVRSLCLTSLNPERAALLLRSFLLEQRVPPPAELSPLEQVLPLPPRPAWGRALWGSAPPLTASVVLGARLSSLQLSGGWGDLLRIRQRYRSLKYWPVCQGGRVHVIVHQAATSADLLQAYIHALVLAQALSEREGTAGTDAAELAAQQWLREHLPGFLLEMKKAGWAVERVLLSPGVWQADWPESAAES